MGRLLILLLLFLSGFAALVYEVLWLKDLQVLFGSTAYSAATVLAAFFLGQALGGQFWGNRAASFRSALRGYAFLEAAIAVSAAACLVMLEASSRFYVPAYARLEHSLGLVLAAKFLVSMAVLLVPSFFMGGTLPVIGQYLVARPDRLGRTGSLLYGVNTLGAMCGVLAAGFFLPPLVGYRACYAAAVGINLLIAAVSLVISRAGQAFHPDVSLALRGRGANGEGAPVASDVPASHRGTNTAAAGRISPAVLRVLVFGSGFLVLAMEVLWTRMFAQVLENSVYAFSAILVTLLGALACGSFLANRLCRDRVSPPAVLLVLLVASSLAVGCSPRLLWTVTDGLREIDVSAGWWSYVGAIFLHIAGVVCLPGVLLGSILPYLLRIAQDVEAMAALPRNDRPYACPATAGRVLGNLLAINTAGAILGSLCAGFLLIDLLGQHRAVLVVAMAYFALADLLLVVAFRRRLAALALVIAGGFILVALFVSSSTLPVVCLDTRRGESLVRVWEGSHATVAVTRDARNNLELRVNNTRIQGGSSYAVAARALAEIPLLLHPAPRKVFFIGMGTGITAGGALDFPVDEVVVAERIPEVVAAADTYFRPWGNGLLDDPRVRVVREDGRNYLLCKSDRYDVIIGDLVYPEQASSLFARENYQVAASRLAEGGLFAQWVPLYQLTRPEFSIIVRTMLEVFPHVTLWRGDTLADIPAVALVGSLGPLPLQPEHIARELKGLYRTAKIRPGLLRGVPYSYYAGNLRRAESLVVACPLNTDDRPLIEYLVPVSARSRAPGENPWFVSLELIGFYDELFAASPPQDDPLLANLGAREMNYVLGGLSLYKAAVYSDADELETAERWRNDCRARFAKAAGGTRPKRERGEGPAKK